MLADHCVDIGRGDAGRDDLAHKLVRLPNADAGVAHQGDFAIGFELNHGEKLDLRNASDRTPTATSKAQFR
jgi:hypothetical protein